jgi:hypothetical protein
MSVHASERHPRRRVRRWTAAALRDLAYDGAIAAWGMVCLAVLTAGVSVTASLLVFVVGAVVWVGFAYAVRATTSIDRRLAAWQRGAAVPAVYDRPRQRGFVALFKTVSRDRQTWRDVGWLAVNTVAGTTLGLLALASLGVAGDFLSLPLRYWASGPVPGFGPMHQTLAVESAGKALLAGAVGLALVPLALMLARGCAAAHSALAVRFLAPESAALAPPQVAPAFAG